MKTVPDIVKDFTSNLKKKGLTPKSISFSAGDYNKLLDTLGTSIERMANTGFGPVPDANRQVMSIEVC